MSIIDIFYNPTKKLLGLLHEEVDKINALEAKISSLADEQLKEKTNEFKGKLKSANGDKEKEEVILAEITYEAFAVLREAMKRVWGERHFDVQIIGGLVLNQGKIAEMKTGEGKTIVATLALYLNALGGRGVHLVTVNDYLAQHQGEGMGDVFHLLGLTTGIIQNSQISYRFVKKESYKHYSECEGKNLESCTRKEAYDCDITYGTNNEFGFDYLRDNMAPDLSRYVQRGLNFAIVDEIDSILIDEARTPLIISAPAEESTGMYQQFAALVPKLKIETDYIVDEKDRAVSLTDPGIKKMETMLGIENIYEEGGISTVHHLEQALKAHALFKKNKDYIVKEGEIIIVDEFTGRLMPGRRYNEGLHQAIEAKEGVEVKNESQTLATISFQNLFRLYDKLSGMTGTAATEAEEFYKIYKLDVVEIPTHKTVVRDDLPDRIYKTEMAKFEALVREIRERNANGQPILVGTVSVEKNELLSKLLKKAGIKHEILNAKNHAREAKIITKAGLSGAVTVATNMAGRGTDIKLEAKSRELGGLHVIGTERHESRRIDNQLRGRSGRQGDPGSTQFYVSMEDDLMRIFGGERLKNLMDRLGLPEDVPIENKLINHSIETAQKKVEGHNFDTRKHLVEYDDVLNKQREVIYRKRRKILESVASKEGSLEDEIKEIIFDEIEKILTLFAEDKEKINKEITSIFGNVVVESYDIEKVKELAAKLYKARENKFGEKIMRDIERASYLRTIDMLWVEHLTTMDELRAGIGLRGYGQRDPLVEYKQEGYQLFQNLLGNIESTLARTIYKVEIMQVPPKRNVSYEKPDENDIGGLKEEESDIAVQKVSENIASSSPVNSDVSVTIRDKSKSVYDRMGNSGGGGSGATIAKRGVKVGRNDPCPCGSGKKYKKCHGR